MLNLYVLTEKTLMFLLIFVNRLWNFRNNSHGPRQTFCILLASIAITVESIIALNFSVKL